MESILLSEIIRKGVVIIHRKHNDGRGIYGEIDFSKLRSSHPTPKVMYTVEKGNPDGSFSLNSRRHAIPYGEYLVVPTPFALTSGNVTAREFDYFANRQSILGIYPITEDTIYDHLGLAFHPSGNADNLEGCISVQHLNPLETGVYWDKQALNEVETIAENGFILRII